MTRPRMFCAALLVLAMNSAHALLQPVPVGADPHFRKAPYVLDVFEVKVRAGVFLEIELSPGENDIHFAMGDREAWTVKASGNVLALKPKALRPDTNLKVWSSTSNRVYWFKLVSVKDRHDVETWHLSFDYPPDPPKPLPAPPPPNPAVVAAQLAAREERDVEHALGGGAPNAADEQRAPRERDREQVINGNYGIIGPEALTPTSAYDNGEQTVLTFAPNNPLPAVFVKEEDGSETRVPQHVENDMLIIHRVARKFVLRHLGQVACLINGSFSPTGPNSDTKTISDSVVREVRKADHVPQ